MNTLSKDKTLLIGITLFSMFFGAGNLIFPPLLAYQAGDHVVMAMAGFLITAVGFPVLGIIAVTKSKGLQNLANRVHPLFAIILTILAYLSIGPGLAIPRTAVTSFEMTLAPWINESSFSLFQFLYSLVFFGIALWVALRPDALTDRLGKIMTPILLVLIVVMFVSCLLQGLSGISTIQEKFQDTPFATGFLDGYQTMDTIAALNYGIVISMNIQHLGIKKESVIIKEAGKAGLVAGVVLTLVYVMLGFVGYISGGLHSFDNGAQSLSYMSRYLFGEMGQIIVGIIFFIACLNTCIALFCSCSEYFNELLPKISYRKWLVFFAFTSVIVSNAGLNQIIAISVPILNAIYPVSIVLIILSFIFHEKRSWTYRVPIILTAISSITYTIYTLGISLPLLHSLNMMFPLHDSGLSWILPAIGGVVIGVVVDYFVDTKKSKLA